MHLSYIASILFTHVKITRQWNWVYRYIYLSRKVNWYSRTSTSKQRIVSASGAFYADRSMTREFKILGRSKKEQQDICFFNSPLFIIDFSPLAHTPKQGRVVSGDVRYGIVHFKNSRENGYKLWAQWFLVRFLGSFRWTSVSYDWWMVFKATINQSTCKPKQSQKSLPARTLVRILLIVSGMRNFGSSVAGTQSDSKSPHLGSSQVNSSSVCG